MTTGFTPMVMQWLFYLELLGKGKKSVLKYTVIQNICLLA